MISDDANGTVAEDMVEVKSGEGMYCICNHA